jgi:hypothetical protein
MKRSVVLISFVWWMAVSGPSFAAAEKTPEALEKQYEAERNPRKRAEIARELMNQRLEELRATIGTGTMLEESSLILEKYRAALERLGPAVREAAHTGTSKSTEVHLRNHIRELENLKISVSMMERPFLEKLLAPAIELREEVLYSIMHPPKK